MIGEIMEFPETFDKFADSYGFIDNKEVYTNSSQLIPVFRVKQWLEHVSALSKNKCFDGMTNGEVRPKGEWIYKPVKKYCSPDCWHPPCADCLTWNKEEGSWLEDEMFCSKCDWQNCDEIKSNFCPYCGADMRGNDDEQT